jgi:hypothetical protein
MKARVMTALKSTSIPSLSMVGIGVMIVSLALGYYYFKKASLLSTTGAVGGNVGPVSEVTTEKTASG